jgi:hypothetical protein
MANPPRFNVYLDPRPLLSSEQFYKPPQHQDDFVMHLVKYGYQPTINSLGQPKKHEVQGMNGLVYLHEDQKLIRCNEYVDGQILCIQWYAETLSDEDLDHIAAYMKPFYCMDGGLECPPDTYTALLEAGCFATTKVQKAGLQSEFIGSELVL